MEGLTFKIRELLFLIAIVIMATVLFMDASDDREAEIEHAVKHAVMDCRTYVRIAQEIKCENSKK